MLSRLLNRRFLRTKAGPAYFERGEIYLLEGRVGAVLERDGAVSAKVKGTRSYRVSLWPEEGEILHSCTCPLGRDGAFCKHCVAVGLAWIERAGPKRGGRKKSSKPATTMDDVRDWLRGQDTDTMVDLILHQAHADDRLGRRLLQRVAHERSTGLDLETYRQALDFAVDAGGFVDYHHAYEYAAGIEEVIDEVEHLLGEGYAAEVVELAEYSLEEVEAAIGHTDDSDGNLGMILRRLQDLHLAACKKARPDPEALAERLFLWELQTEWDTFHGAAETYRGVLGKKGLAAYHRLADEQWAEVRELGPGEDDRERYGARFRITGIMENLARQSGDTEALVEVRKRTLSSAYDFYKIAEAYRKAGKHDEALEWAEKGVAAFPERTDSRLRELLADEYHRHRRHGEALEVIWKDFVEWPDLGRYQSLMRHAERAGLREDWRARALDLLRPDAPGAKHVKRRGQTAGGRQRDGSKLVGILLWEGEVEAAWQAACEGGCSEDHWLELADRRAGEHPEDAVPIYQRWIPRTLDRKDKEAYREAVALLKKVQNAMTRLDQRDSFDRYLESVRADHRRKRNFMSLLDREDW